MTDKEELEITLMNAQIETLQAEREKLRTETERFRQEMQWEPWKAVATMMTAGAALFGAGMAFATILFRHWGG